MTNTLTIGVAQLAPEATLHENRDKIIHFIDEARSQGCRMLVVPEGALYSPEGTPKADIDTAIRQVQQETARHNMYVILVALYRLANDAQPMHNRLLVIGPDGGIIQTYDKLWGDQRFPNVPGPFVVDGVICCATICADRWLRSTEELPVFAGAQIIIECSGNYENEWIPELQWYWYVPRAIRNNVYVVLCNQARDRSRVGLWGPGHGHSCIIVPDGTFLAAAEGESDRLLVATLDMALATRAEAIRRHAHPLFKRFWDVGITLMQGGQVEAPPLEPLTSPEVPITIAAAQMACSRDIHANLVSIERLLRLAKLRGADVVGFPELALTGTLTEDIMATNRPVLESALSRVQQMARAMQLCVVLGAPHIADSGERHNSAYVISPDGTILTRYDQLVIDRPDVFVPGDSSRAMWYTVKGVPAVVTIGRDGLWTELAELAAIRGAQVHMHICYDTDKTQQGKLLRKQLWACLASYRTLTATVNAAEPINTVRPSAAGSGYSMIWQDFFRGTSGPSGGYWPHCAEWLAQAAMNETVIHATQTVAKVNSQFERMTQRSNPQMRPWYIVGSQAICDHILQE